MSVYKDKKSGKWRAVVNYKDFDGKQCRISRSYDTKSEANEGEIFLRAKYRNEKHRRLTFNQLFSAYIQNERESLRLTTLSITTKHYIRYIKPMFDNIEVEDFTPSLARKWKEYIDNKTTKVGNPLSITTKNDIYATFKKLISYAKRNYNVNCNALDIVGNFKSDPNKITEEKPLKYWTLEQFQEFCKAYQKMKKKSNSNKFLLEAIYVYLNTLYYSGLRKGEANALYLEDFVDDIINPYLRVNKSVTLKVKSFEYLVTPPKNKSSIREVPIPDYLATLIRKHVNTYIKGIPVSKGQHIFLFGGLTPLKDTTVTEYKNRAEKLANLPHIRVHDLRHSYASLLINNKVDITIISKLLGHATTAMTWSVYSHLYPKTTNEAIKTLEKLHADCTLTDDEN